MKRVFTMLLTIATISAAANDDAALVRAVAGQVMDNHKTGYVDRKTKEVYPSTERIPSGADVYLLSPSVDWHYSLGILDMAMVRASKYFGEPSYAAFAAGQVDYALANYKFFEKRYAPDGHGPFHFLWRYSELDHCAAQGAALIDLMALYPGKPYKKWIDRAADHITHKQVRLADSTLVRSWPYANTLWADDLSMALLFLTRMYGASGDKAYLEDGIRQVRNFNRYLWDDTDRLFWHAYYADLGRTGGAHWGRCNGWVMLGTAALLDAMPADHPARGEVTGYLTRHIMGVAAHQGPDGMWHQLLDREDSYTESSCTAIFTYCVARAINKGWLDARYASIALGGWDALKTLKMDKEGNLRDVCVGTGIGNDMMFYYRRPVKTNEIHGLGLIIETGIEMIELKKHILK